MACAKSGFRTFCTRISRTARSFSVILRKGPCSPRVLRFLHTKTGFRQATMLPARVIHAALLILNTPKEDQSLFWFLWFNRPMKELVFLKLGGSLITDKTQPYTPLLEVMNDLALQIKTLEEGLLQ